MISTNGLIRLATALTVLASFCVTNGAAQENANKGQRTGLVKQIDQGRLQQRGVRPDIAQRNQPLPSLTVKQQALTSRPRNLAADFDRPAPGAGKSLPAPPALSTSHLLAAKSSKPLVPEQGVNPSSVKAYNAKHPDASKVQ